MTITEFLLARIAEDEAVARELIAEGPWNDMHQSDRSGPTRDDEYSGLNIGAGRVLAECETKRRIVGEHSGVDPCDAHDGATMLSIDCDTLLFLAAVYADHPDYDEAWRP